MLATEGQNDSERFCIITFAIKSFIYLSTYELAYSHASRGVWKNSSICLIEYRREARSKKRLTSISIQRENATHSMRDLADYTTRTITIGERTRWIGWIIMKQTCEQKYDQDAETHLAYHIHTHGVHQSNQKSIFYNSPLLRYSSLLFFRSRYSLSQLKGSNNANHFSVLIGLPFSIWKGLTFSDDVLSRCVSYNAVGNTRERVDMFPNGWELQQHFH